MKKWLKTLSYVVTYSILLLILLWLKVEYGSFGRIPKMYYIISSIFNSR